MVSFSIVVPTKGRPSLARTIDAIATQLVPGDEVLVICNDRDFVGNYGRNRGQEKATGTHLLYCDDDDVFLPGALAKIRAWAEANPTRIGLFRRRFNARVPLQWAVEELVPGNIQSMCMCVPNIAGKVGTWRDSGRGRPPAEASAIPVWSDTMFVEETARMQETEWVWVDEVIGWERPETSSAKRLRSWLAPRARLRELTGRP